MVLYDIIQQVRKRSGDDAENHISIVSGKASVFYNKPDSILVMMPAKMFLHSQSCTSVIVSSTLVRAL